jgi:hypothetical protein|tara:strand:- start:466 stop:768 length:303 start_codon:yes stop_codon:yes gene_type:complete
MPEIICVSVTAETKKVFDELRKRKPVGTPFSKSLKLIVEDYLRGDQNVFEYDFNSILLSSNIEVWQKLINAVSVEDFKKIQLKTAQINNLINKRVEKCLK